MKLLSTLAAVRLDEERDDIENTLSLALVETSKAGAIKDRGLDSLDPLASSTWETVIYIFIIV
jgi:protein SEY1